MECQSTTKNLKINKNKTIGEIVVVVEGESDEFKLLKHIFTEVLDYDYISIKRNKIMQHEFHSKSNKNCTVIVANTSNSSINTIMEDEEYKDKLYSLLKREYHRSLKSTPIYLLWDRDKETTKEEYVVKALDTFTNSMDNNYDMNGIILLSYPCLESYHLSNFDKNLWRKKFTTSADAKKEFKTSRNSIYDITEKTLLLAVENMHRSMLGYSIRSYEPSDFKKINETIFRKEKECYKENRYFNALSLISIMLIDLGIITEIDD